MEVFWRELILEGQKWGGLPEHQNSYKVLVDAYRDYINMGNPFEILDGDNLCIQTDFLRDVFSGFRGERKVAVISIMGNEKTGKSTILNYLFGCEFLTKQSRCTKGINGTLVKSTIPEYDDFLIIDSEGLESLVHNQMINQQELDRKIALFCFMISNIILVNCGTYVLNNFRQIMYNCLLGYKCLDNTQKYTKKPII